MKKLVAWTFLTVFFSVASFPAGAASKVPPQLVREFTQACLLSFEKSDAKPDPSVGKTICECTAKDSLNQGVTASALKRETTEIQKNPKYEIQDTHLMDAFRYCTIELMRKAHVH